MNIPLELKIGSLPWRYASGRVEVPGVRLVAGAPWELRAGNRRWRLAHIRPEEGPPDPVGFARYARKHQTQSTLPLVLAPYIREDVRRALEAEGVSYFDFFGNVHLQAPPAVLVHVQMPVRPELSKQLGYVGVRGAQTMLADPSHSWGVTELAEQAQMSAGQAQNLMKTLEAEDLVYTEGRGPRRRRHIREPGRFLDWLALQRPGRVPRGRLNCALYARTPEDLWDRIERGIKSPHAITGAAAATLLGTSGTALPHTVIRVATKQPLRMIAREVGAEPSERGANIALWTDDGRLGTLGSFQEKRRTIAPKVRIYIDLMSELRGEDLASDFRERVLGF